MTNKIKHKLARDLERGDVLADLFGGGDRVASARLSSAGASVCVELVDGRERYYRPGARLEVL